MAILYVSNEDPVYLDGYIDSSSNLQIGHDTDNLVDYEQTMECSHDTNTSITVRIFDFNDGGTWTMNAEHVEGTTQTWSRGADYCEYEFTSEPTNPYAVDITATKGASSKERRIWIKPKPKAPV